MEEAFSTSSKGVEQMNDDYKRIVLTHANLKRPIHLVMGSIGGYHESPANKCTHVYTNSGVFPALETPEEIDKLIENETTAKGGN